MHKASNLTFNRHFQSGSRAFGWPGVLAAALAFGLFSCSHAGKKEPVSTSTSTIGWGELVFALSDSVSVRIPGDKTEDSWTLYNGLETMTLSNVTDSSDCWKVPVFEGVVCLTDSLNGLWTDVLRTEPYQVPVQWLESGQPETFGSRQDSMSWRLSFGEDDPWFGNLSLLASETGAVQGSVATATGDFRYLHGTLSNKGALTLQTFDGAHLFLFTATLNENGELSQGDFFSGTHYHTTFTGAPLAPTHGSLSDGNQALWTGRKVRYSGVGLDGLPTSWNSERISHPHLISVMGTWCPNCMDEHRLILELMAQFPALEVHTLAFERGLGQPGGEGRALERLNHYAQEMGIHQWSDRWRIVLAGPASKTAATDRLPFLHKVISFPTTIVVAPGQTSPWIHTGFNGPATGFAYASEKARFVRAVNGDSTESH